MATASDPVKEAMELLKIAMKDDKLGKKGDSAKQLAAATAYVEVERLFEQALKGERSRSPPPPPPPRRLPCPHQPSPHLAPHTHSHPVSQTPT